MCVSLDSNKAQIVAHMRCMCVMRGMRVCNILEYNAGCWAFVFVELTEGAAKCIQGYLKACGRRLGLRHDIWV